MKKTSLNQANTHTYVNLILLAISLNSEALPTSPPPPSFFFFYDYIKQNRSSSKVIYSKKIQLDSQKNRQIVTPGREGTLGYSFITLVPNDFLLIGLATLGTFFEFGLAGS